MPTEAAATRWTLEEVQRIYQQPLLELIEQAHEVHRQHQQAAEVQLCHLLSVKTGGCPEDCAYCPQSARYDTGVEAGKLMEKEEVLAAATRARAAGSSRFCMGAAWRQVKEGPEFDRMLEMVRGVADLGLEVCCTLGMVNESQAQRLAAAGLTAYNHNLDTSREFYGQIITTRTYDDRLRTIENVRAAGISVCCGGILGLGEGESDRARLLLTLANLNPPPESVPINALVAVEGTPLAGQTPLGGFELVRAIATARILMPDSKVRLSAGRLSLSDEAQALCFYAGANSIFVGEKLLTTPNPGLDHDHRLLDSLGLKPQPQAPAPAPRRDRRTAGAALDDAWAGGLEQLAAQSRRRRLPVRQGEDCCSNDYLGLARHPQVRAAMAQALQQGLELGATGSRLVRGNHPVLAALEEEFAAWQGAEAALLYGSGYAANFGLLSALLDRQDIVFSDAHNHASLVDGLRAAGARRVIVPHNDPAALRDSLRRHPAIAGQRRWVVVESLYSMEGDFAPLEDIGEVCRETGAALIVDEAHATGLYGPEGAGRVAAGSAALRATVAARVHPCGKALGASGGVVTGSRSLIEWLVNRSRSFIYSTAPSPLLGVQLSAAIAVVRREPRLRQQVVTLAHALRAALRAAGLSPLGHETSPIVPLVLGEDAAALHAAAALAEAGFDVRAIRPPTVPEGSA
ncbi:MAG TPA: biotin synthase BioB, partial [Terriglobales bacterium]|nr:biotin synthase BioB [Terriglobales bacterium]